MLLLSEAQVRQCLNINRCIESNRIALGSLRWRRRKINQSIEQNYDTHENTAIVPRRIAIPYHSRESSSTSTSSSSSTKNIDNKNAHDMTLFKPAAFYPSSSSSSSQHRNQNTIMGLKVVSTRANNPSIGKPTVPANILLLNAETGEVDSMVAATYLTAARTAAGSAIATELCLQQVHGNILDIVKDLHLVVFGAGLQAELHILCLYHIPLIKKHLKRITIANRNLERAELLKETIEELLLQKKKDDLNDLKNNTDKEQQIPITRKSQISIHCVSLQEDEKIQNAVESANVIVTATNTSTPLFNWEWVQPGCHINGVGSYQANSEEVCSKFAKNHCVVVCDTMEALDVGDLKLIKPDETKDKDNDNCNNKDDAPFIGLLGDVLAGEVIIPSLTSRQKKSRYCTFFKSVGTAIQDVITAEQVVRSANAKGIGTIVDMS
mmetsp:Transcript_4275/g.5552  ORF Transcript_4275/g.5552 Transcript_4275/m.5552 type:complete len:437 (+) Transcript_4275:95-1405(+)